MILYWMPKEVTREGILDCKTTRSGWNYRGNTAHSLNGHDCLPWSNQTEYNNINNTGNMHRG